jgi:hypothetical protein
MFGAWVAALAGAWFAVGRVLSPLWNAHGTVALGTPIGGTVTRTLVALTYFTGLGVIIVFLAALSMGRLTVVGVRDARLSERAAEEDAAVTGAAPATDPVVYERPAGDRSVFERPAGERTTVAGDSEAPAGEETTTRTPVSPGSQP